MLSTVDKMTANVTSRTVGLLVVVATWISLAGPMAAQTIPPDADWRTIETEHFRVTFPSELERLARVTAGRAERAYVALTASLTEPPKGRTDIVLTDHIDRSNGSARAAPYRRVVLFARPPIEGLALSHFDDWLEVVLVHELAHIFHFEVTGPIGGALRNVFGRVPVTWPFFPGQATPRWVVEGIATWYESDLTESGRVRGAQHEMVMRTAALDGRLEPIDEASGLSPEWPAGRRPYIYGSLFFDYLAREYGVDRIRAFVDAVAGQLVPYRLNAAARSSFGVSFDEAWRAWQVEVIEEAVEVRTRVSSHGVVTEFTPLTRGARNATYVRGTSTGEVVFSVSDGREDTELRVIGRDGVTHVLTRLNGRSAFDIDAGGTVVFSQLEALGPYRSYSDLYSLEMGTGSGSGEVRRLTRGARLEQPTVSRDGETIVAVRGGGGSTTLVTVDPSTGRVEEGIVPDDPEVHWAYPSISPDGRWLAATRWSAGAYMDVVVIPFSPDGRGGTPVEVTTDRAIDTGPVWSPDGRWLVWASERTGVPNILAASFALNSGRVGPVRQATNVVTGAHFPAISQDGAWLYASVYHSDGWEVERTPFDPETFTLAAPLDDRFRIRGETDGESQAPSPVPVSARVGVVPDAPVQKYSAAKTILPRFWQPAFLPAVSSRGENVIDPSFGFLTRAQDLVGRHTIDADVLLSLSGSRFSGDLRYQWAGLGNPLLSVGASQFWDAAGPFGQQVGGQNRRFFVEERERTAFASVTAQRVRLRNRATLSLSGGMAWEEFTVLEEDGSPSTDLVLRDPDTKLADVRATFTYSTARAHAFSISTEEGVTFFLRARTRPELDLAEGTEDDVDFDRSVEDLVGSVQGFKSFGGSSFADWVLAARVAGGIAGGPGADAFHFDVGGASGAIEPVTGFGLLGGRSFFFPTRGFENGDRGGRYAWAASVEYRFPLALVNKGLGLFPLHLDRVSGTVFLDAANAWGPNLDLGSFRFDNPHRDPLASTGVEVVTEALSLFSIPVTLRTGVAVPISEGSGASVYLRFGRSF